MVAGSNVYMFACYAMHVSRTSYMHLQEDVYSFPPAVIVQLATLQEDEVDIKETVKLWFPCGIALGLVSNPVGVVAYLTQY